MMFGGIRVELERGAQTLTLFPAFLRFADDVILKDQRDHTQAIFIFSYHKSIMSDSG